MRNSKSSLWIYIALLADVVLFFHKPLFSTQYLFPWDFRAAQLPLITFLADQLRTGHFAMWNPYEYCGFPVFATIDACYFEPLILLSALIGSRLTPEMLPMLVEWAVVIHIWMGGIAAYHLFGKLGAGRAAALAGAVIFQTGGFVASRAQNIDMLMAVSWMPLAWLAVLHLADGFSRGWVAALSLALGLSILGGFPQVTLAVFVSVVVLVVLLVAFRYGPVRLLISTAAACILGILSASVAFIPAVQLTNHSVAKYRSGWLGATGGGLYPQTLVSLVLPNHYNVFDVSSFHGPGDLTFLYQYCSIAGLLLALYAIATRRNRFVALLAIMMIFGIFFMLGEHTAPWRWFYPLLPERIRIGVHPEYTYCILTLCIAGLAALGLETIRVKEAVRWGVAAIIAADLFLTSSGRPMNVVSLKQEPGVTRNAFDGSPALLDGVRSRVNLDIPPSRIDTVEASMFWAIGAGITDVPSANGVSPLAPENIIQLRLFLHEGFPWGWYYPLENLDSPVLDLLNVRYVVAGPKGADRLRALPRFRHIASLPGNELFENLTVMPRFNLVHRVRSVSSRADARGIIDRREIDFRQTALAKVPVPLSSGSSGTDDVKVIDYQPTSIDLAVQSRGTSLLVASETEYPGWDAWVDGRPVPIHRVDIAFRGVVVPDGGHRVRMEFRPAILPVSLAISVATGLFLLLWGWTQPVKKKD